MKRSHLLIACLSLAVAALPAATQTHVRFSATVKGGEGFQKTIRPGLVFELHPQEEDWWFVIEPNLNSDINFAKCVTGPLHGPTVLDLLAWQWATNEPAGYEQTAPQTREFDFVLDNAADQKACAQASRVAEDVRQGRNQIGNPLYKAPPLGHARVLIRSVRMQPASAGGKPRFAEVSFDVEITLPAMQRQK